MSSCYIERASGDDWFALGELECSVFDYDVISFRQMKYLLSRPGAIFFKARSSDGSLVGYIALLTRKKSYKVRIYSLAVLSSARGHGVGGALLRAAEQYAAEAGFTTMCLEQKEGNSPALHLYLSHGYIISGTRSAYYTDGSDALLLQKYLFTKEVKDDSSIN